MTQLTHGSLFSGIGGFEEGAKMSGIETIWNCEYEPFQRSILKQHYPNSIQYDDVRTMQGQRYVDIISGGFPCQDISVAGKGVGIKGERSGLWSEMYRILGGGRPKYAIIENSPMLLVRGFERVLYDLSEIGYNAQWQCISNSAFGFPHKRERVYIIAYSNEVREQSNLCKHGAAYSIFKKWSPDPFSGHSLSKRIHEMPAHSTVRNGDGLSNWAHRVGSIGNSVNPVIAKYLFECIKEFDNQLN